MKVRDRTLVTLNGKRVDAKAIPEGVPVRARFQLEGDDTVAVEIEAVTK